MSKVNFGTLNSKNLCIMVIGTAFSKESVVQVKRANEMGIVPMASPKAFQLFKGQGAKTNSFVGETASAASVLKYPKSGLPYDLINAILGISTDDLRDLKRANIKPVHVIFTEINSEIGSVQAEESGQVLGEIHHNTMDALRKGMAAGRITATSAIELEEILDILEEEQEITHEVFEAKAVISTIATMQALQKWDANLGESLQPFVKQANSVLTEAGILEGEEA